MNQYSRSVIILIVFCLACTSTEAQIIINGPKPTRERFWGESKSLTVSYVYNRWVDVNNDPVPGYSKPLELFHSSPSDPFGVENNTVSTGINLGYENQLRAKFGLRISLTASKLKTGINQRKDLMVTDESIYSQLSLYGKYLLSKRPAQKFRVELLAGPELIYARKQALIEQYVNVLEPEFEIGDYRETVKVLEVAAVTGLGFSYRVSDSFAVFSEGLIGVSLPGTGFKISNSGVGFKYLW